VPPASRPVLAAVFSASLVLSVTLTAAAPALAGDTRPPELVFAGEIFTLVRPSSITSSS
jgi:hypothetical protein